MNVLLTQIPPQLVVLTYNDASFEVADRQCEMPEEVAAALLAHNPFLRDCVVVEIPV